MKDIYIIIPALEPTPDFCGYIRTLSAGVSGKIVVIDDGSGSKYKKIFEKIASRESCTVLTHGKNRGKGSALKTGFQYVHECDGKEKLVICADCDGQHTVRDIVRMAAEAEQCPGTLVLGERNFSKKKLPLRSVFGNRISSVLFWLISGIWLEDTQTGLRAFDGSLLSCFREIPGEGFEYEMRMLSVCTQNKIPIAAKKIETVYLNGNEDSHFRPFRDSVRVIGVLFDEFQYFFLSAVFWGVLGILLCSLFLKIHQGQKRRIFSRRRSWSYEG